MCPNEICDHGVKVKTTNVVGYVFFPRNLLEVWPRCGVAVAVNLMVLGDVTRGI